MCEYRYINPYTPGAGFMPSYLAGRDSVIDDAKAIIGALISRYPQQSVIFYGLRGVGKTVLLNRLEEIADEFAILYEHIEIEEKDGFIDQLTNSSMKFLRSISAKKNVQEFVHKAIDALKMLKFKTSIDSSGALNAELAFDNELISETTLSDRLTDVFVSLGNAANKSEDTICFFIDEIQYLKKEELQSLINAIHRVNQKRLPIMIFGAGLPKVFKELGDAKSYSERLFKFVKIDALEYDEAKLAIAKPAAKFNVTYENLAIDKIISITKGYPYFIQEFCNLIWKNTENSIITEVEVENLVPGFFNILDNGFFKVRYERCTKREKDFMFAMVKCGSLPCNISNVAKILKKAVNEVSPVRAQLISKGLIYSTGYAEIDFTVPEFDHYLKRVNPGLESSEFE